MTNWKVAPSYKNAKIISVNEDTRKAYIEEKCDRCGGLGFIVSRVENDQYIPIPVDGGVCYKCNGEKVIRKWVKAYTEEEMDKYLASQERARERKAEKAEQERQEKLNKSKENQEELLAKWGYDVENPLIWLVGGGNTYAIKDQLKEAGCKFNPSFGWYNTNAFDVPSGYGLVSINFYDVYTWFPLSERFELKDNAKEIADAAKVTLEPESHSEYIGEIKERLRDLQVTLTAIHSFDGFYGTSTMYIFQKDEDVLVWTTSSCKYELEIGEHILLTGTVKDHKLYKNIKQTILSRCIIKKEAEQTVSFDFL